MKKKMVRICMGLLGLCLTVGVVCCIMRPSYVKEAVEILFGNELEFEQTEESSVGGEE